MSEQDKFIGRLRLDLSKLKDDLDKSNKLLKENRKSSHDEFTKYKQEMANQAKQLGITIKKVSIDMKSFLDKSTPTKGIVEGFDKAGESVKMFFKNTNQGWQEYNAKLVENFETNKQIENHLERLKANYKELKAQKELSIKPLRELHELTKKLNEQDLSTRQRQNAAALQRQMQSEIQRFHSQEIRQIQHRFALIEKGTKEGLALRDKELEKIQRIIKLEEINANTKMKATKALREMTKVREGEAQMLSTSGMSARGFGFFDRAAVSMQYAVAGMGLMRLRNTVREIQSTIKDVERQQRILQAVTGESVENVRRFTNEAMDVAMASATSLQNVTLAYERLAKAGVRNQDLQSMAAVVTRFQNIAEIDDSQRVVKYLVSTARQLNMEFSESARVLDVFWNVAKNTAVDVEDLAVGMERYGSLGRQLGMTLEEMTALTATIAANMGRTGSEVGTAMRSILANIVRNADALERAGVSIKKNANEYHSAMTMFQNISNRMRELESENNEVEKMAIARLVGITRRMNEVITIADSMDDYYANLENAMNSAGAAAQAEEIVLQSYAKQLERLSTSFQQLAWSLGEAGVMQVLSAVTVGMTTFLQVLNSIPQPLKTVVLGLITMHTTMAMIKRLKLADSMGNLIGRLTTSVSAVRSAVVTNNQLAVSAKSATVATGGLTLAAKALWSTLIPLGFVLTALTFGVISYTRAKNKARNSSTQMLDEVRNEMNELNNLIDEYNKLATSVERNAETRQRLNEVMLRMNEIAPGSLQFLREENRLLDENIEKLWEQFHLRNKSQIEGARSSAFGSFEDDLRRYEESQKRLAKLQAERQDLIDNWDEHVKRIANSGITDDTDLAITMLNNKARQLKSDIGEVNNQMAEFRDKVLQNVDAIKDAFAVEFRIPLQSEEVQREFDRIFDVDWIKDGTISLPILLNFTDGNIIETEEQIKNSIQSILSAAQDLENKGFKNIIAQMEVFRRSAELSEESIDNWTESMIAQLRTLNLSSQAFEMGKNSIVNMMDAMRQNKITFDDFIENFDQLAKSTQDAIREMESLAGTYHSLAEGQQLSASQLMDLILKYDEIADYMILHNKIALDQKEILEIVFNARRDNLKLELQMQADVLSARIENLNEQLKAEEQKVREAMRLNRLQAVDAIAQSEVATSAIISQIRQVEIEYARLQKRLDIISNITVRTIAPRRNTSTSSNNNPTNNNPTRDFINNLSGNTMWTDHFLELNRLQQQYATLNGNTNEAIRLKMVEGQLLKEHQRILESNRRSIENKLRSTSRNTQAYSDLQKALNDTNKQLQQNRNNIVAVNRALEDHRRIVRDKTIEAQRLILRALQDRDRALKDSLEEEKRGLEESVRLQYEADREKLRSQINLYREERALLRRKFDEQRRQREEEKLQEELVKLQERYNQISLDNSGMFEREKLDLRKRIADLQARIIDNQHENELRASEEALDERIRQLEQEENIIEEHFQNVGELWSRYFSKRLQEITEVELPALEKTMQQYWDEVENIMNMSQDAIVTFLRNNLHEYRDAGRLQREAYLEGWGELFDFIFNAKGVNELARQLEQIRIPAPIAVPNNSGTTRNTPANPPRNNPPPPPPSSPPPRNIPIDRSNQHLLTPFATGGLATRTEPIMVHGSKKMPERILSARQTQSFERLVNILDGYRTPLIPGLFADYMGKSQGQSVSYGDTNIKVEMYVDKLDDNFNMDRFANDLGNKIKDTLHFSGTNMTVQRR